ncbi:hypothetical protein [Burkholderia sp. A1]|uniref:hypothetical protein n=1 Tax=Burkholderia sp. A1 TaxID=148446 RepID=UPI00046A5EBD|nr:hypothetical protein [Burkholderia sp. A1]
MIRITHSAISLAGVIGAQAAFVASLVLIGQAQGVEALGMFGYRQALGGFGGTVLALRYELACVSNDKRLAFEALLHVLVLAGCMVSLAATCLLAAGRVELYPMLAYAAAVSAQLAIGGYLNSLRRYGLIATARLAPNLLLLGWLVVGAAGTDAFVVYARANALVAVLMLAVVLGGERRLVRGFRWSRAFFVSQRRYPIYLLPATAFGAMQIHGLSIAMPSWFDASSAGLFAVAWRFGSFPVSMLGQSIGSVYRRDALTALCTPSCVVHDGVARLHRTYALALAALALVHGAAAWWLFSPVVVFCFGAAAQAAVSFYRALAPWFMLQMVYVPLAQTYLVAGAQRTDLLFQCGSGLLLAGALLSARSMGLSALDCVHLFSAVGVANTLAGIALTRHLAGRASRSAQSPVVNEAPT